MIDIETKSHPVMAINDVWQLVKSLELYKVQSNNRQLIEQAIGQIKIDIYLFLKNMGDIEFSNKKGDI